MIKWVSAMLLCLAAGCTSTVPAEGYSVCSTEPGSYACQIEQYQRVSQ
jgi:hypothetical protein